MTQTLDRPVTGRVFFEQVIRDNLDTGRPDEVSLIFDRRLKRRGPRATPGRFRTRVITEGVNPESACGLQAHRHQAVPQQGTALRTETTINDTRDFQIGKRLVNLPALREIGFSANRGLLRVQRLDHDPITAANALHTITNPITTETVHGLIERIPHSHRYQVTDTGLHTAMLLTRVHDRLLPTGLAHLNDPASTSQLRTVANAYQLAIDNLIRDQEIAA